MTKMKVVVYCSSQAGLPEEVTEGAALIAQTIGECGAVYRSLLFPTATQLAIHLKALLQRK